MWLLMVWYIEISNYDFFLNLGSISEVIWWNIWHEKFKVGEKILKINLSITLNFKKHEDKKIGTLYGNKIITLNKNFLRMSLIYNTFHKMTNSVKITGPIIFISFQGSFL